MVKMPKRSRLPKAGLKRGDFSRLDVIVSRAKRSELDRILERVDKEIRLSETAIAEGFEKRK